MSCVSSDGCCLDHHDRVLMSDCLVCGRDGFDLNGSPESADFVGSPDIVVIVSLGKYQQLPLEQKPLEEQWVLLLVSPPRYFGQE